MALSFRNVSRYFSTIGFPIHVNPIVAVKSPRRRQYVGCAGIKKSVRGVAHTLFLSVSLATGLSLRSGAKEKVGERDGAARGGASRISRFTLSRPSAPSVDYLSYEAASGSGPVRVFTQ